MDIASQGMPRHEASGMRSVARDRRTILDADSCAVRTLRLLSAAFQTNPIRFKDKSLNAPTLPTSAWINPP